MSIYAPWTEDFVSGARGSVVGTGYGQIDNVSGTGTSVIDPDSGTDYNLTHRGCLITCAASGTRILRLDTTADGDMDAGWIRFAFTVVTAHSTTNSTVVTFFAANNVTLAGSIRIDTATGAIQARDSAGTLRWTSINLAPGDYEVSVKPTPNAWAVKVYSSGVCVSSVGVGLTGTGHTAGVLTTGYTVGSIDTLRIGMQTTGTGAIRIYWLRADTTTEPAGYAGGTPVVSYTTADETIIDATGSTGVVTLVQTDGATVTPVESPTGVFVITHPTPFTEDLVFTITATHLGVPISESITIPFQGSIPKSLYIRDLPNVTWI